MMSSWITEVDLFQKTFILNTAELLNLGKLHVPPDLDNYELRIQTSTECERARVLHHGPSIIWAVARPITDVFSKKRD